MEPSPVLGSPLAIPSGSTSPIYSSPVPTLAHSSWNLKDSLISFTNTLAHGPCANIIGFSMLVAFYGFIVLVIFSLISMFFYKGRGGKIIKTLTEFIGITVFGFSLFASVTTLGYLWLGFLPATYTILLIVGTVIDLILVIAAFRRRVDQDTNNPNEI